MPQVSKEDFVPGSAKNWIVETDWLADHLDAPDLIVFDGSWHLPNSGRDAKAEYLAEHIPGALFFDIDDLVDEKSPLQYALGAFLKNSDTLGSGVADFKENFDVSDTAALKEYVGELQKEKSWLPAATWRDGLDSTVTVATANQAILKAERIVFKPEWYELA